MLEQKKSHKVVLKLLGYSPRWYIFVASDLEIRYLVLLTEKLSKCAIARLMFFNMRGFVSYNPAPRDPFIKVIRFDIVLMDVVEDCAKSATRPFLARHHGLSTDNAINKYNLLIHAGSFAGTDAAFVRMRWWVQKSFIKFFSKPLNEISMERSRNSKASLGVVKNTPCFLHQVAFNCTDNDTFGRRSQSGKETVVVAKNLQVAHKRIVFLVPGYKCRNGTGNGNRNRNRKRNSSI